MTFHSLTTKADIFLADIVQLLCVVLVDKLSQRHLFRTYADFRNCLITILILK